MSGRVVLGARGRLALGAGWAAGKASRAAGRGAGATVPGRVALRLDPFLLGRLAAGRQVTVVSATNGKTTTTRLVAAALGAGGGQVLSNTDGSNLERGVVAALMTDSRRRIPQAALEVDELALGAVVARTGADLLILGNLSRDQLDRMTECRVIVGRWQEMFAARAERVRSGRLPPVRVIANADDPLVTAAVTGAWSAGPDAPVRVTWAAVGQPWTGDSAACPRCAQPWVFVAASYRCDHCGFARPDPDWELDGGEVRGPGGLRLTLGLGLPGRSNRANAVLALAAATVRGVAPQVSLEAMRSVTSVSGRYAVVDRAGGPLRMLLAKNPAGWQEMLAQHAESQAGDGPMSGQRPIVLALNAREADGRDTSWIWDVPFEGLAGMRVVVSGERAEDLALRLRYAEIAFTVVRDPLEAVEQARGGSGELVDLLATYTAFTAVHQLVGLPA